MFHFLSDIFPQTEPGTEYDPVNLLNMTFPAELLNQCWFYIIGIADYVYVSKCQAHIYVNMDICIVNYHNNFDHRILEQQGTVEFLL